MINQKLQILFSFAEFYCIYTDRQASRNVKKCHRLRTPQEEKETKGYTIPLGEIKIDQT